MSDLDPLLTTVLILMCIANLSTHVKERKITDIESNYNELVYICQQYAVIHAL